MKRGKANPSTPDTSTSATPSPMPSIATEFVETVSPYPTGQADTKSNARNTFDGAPTLTKEGRNGKASLGPQIAPDGKATATSTPSPSAIEVAELSSIITPSPTTTLEISPTPIGMPSPVIAAGGITIEPAVVANDRATGLKLSGARFGPGITVAIGGRPLSEVTYESPTQLAATLPPGICPGTYAATIVDSFGKQIVGGQIDVQGRRLVTTVGNQPSVGARVNRQTQTLTIPLPLVQVEDTTCASDDWRLSFAVSEFAHDGGRQTFLPKSIRLDGPTLIQPVSAPLAFVDGTAVATLVIPPLAQRASAEFRPSVEIDVPAYAYAGRYASTTSVTVTEVPL